MQSHQTQAEKKILTEFKKLIVTHKFISEVLRIRELIGVPENGLPMSQEDRSNSYFIFYTPSALREKHPEEIPSYMKEMDAGIKRITTELPFCNTYIEQIIRWYIYFNIFLFEEIAWHSELFGLETLCNIADSRKEFQEIFPNFSSQKFMDWFADEEKKHGSDIVFSQHEEKIMHDLHIAWLDDAVKKYPISLRIHESASQRDVVDYVKKNWKHIKLMQDCYRKESGLTFGRTKQNQKILERNEIIYQNRERTAREISKLLQGKHYPDVDIGSIGKIISLEKKKREKK